jgi:flagellar basal body-associated protein FliL
MDAITWVTIGCCIVTLLGTAAGAVLFGLASWALLQAIRQGTEIATLKAERTADKEENNRRFGEVKLQLVEIRGLLIDALQLHRNRDKPGRP